MARASSYAGEPHNMDVGMDMESVAPICLSVFPVASWVAQGDSASSTRRSMRVSGDAAVQTGVEHQKVVVLSDEPAERALFEVRRELILFLFSHGRTGAAGRNNDPLPRTSQ